MLPFIIGGVTLAAVGYGIKECIKDEDCTTTLQDKVSDGALALYDGIDKLEEKLGVGIYDIQTTSTQTDDTTSQIEPLYKLSKDFYKSKKEIYKTSMQKYVEFLSSNSLQSDISTDIKLQKEKFCDDVVSDEVKEYMQQITTILETTDYNLNFRLKQQKDKTTIDENDKQNIYKDAKNIYELCHLKLYDNDSEVNKVEILSQLVKAMTPTVSKTKYYLDLSS